MDYDFEIGRMKDTMTLCLQNEARLAEVQQSQGETLASLARIDLAQGKLMESMNGTMERLNVTMSQLQEISKSTTDRVAEHEAMLRQAERDKAESEIRWKHIDMTIAEIGDKLNGLIGYMDGQNRKQ